ncbi:hypothetical protein [Robbsia sp. KACC 23696]|uniref:hypothetical protein n=1 Tax=Robbsia sp. KACC 23696 TaxID=3149231 RepID=UPI00325BC70A
MNAFIRPLALGDFDGPSLAIEDTIAIAGLKTVPATDALCETGREARSPRPRPLQRRQRVSMHAPAVRRVLSSGWYIDTRVGHGDFGAASAVANAWVRAALAADFTGGLRVGAALHGICGFKPSYRVDTGTARSKADSGSTVALPMYCVGALAPDMQTLIDVAAALDDDFDEALAAHPSKPVRVAWLASEDCSGNLDPADSSYLRAKDWSNVHALLFSACQMPALQADHAIAIAAAAGASRPLTSPFPSSSFTVRLPGLAAAADAAALISTVAGRAQECDVDAPAPDRLAEALRQARDFRAAVDRALTHADVIALPTVHPSEGELDALTRAFNLSGHPALTLPFTSDDGHLHGLQLIARHGDDARLCAAGRWFESLFARHPTATRVDAETRYAAPHPRSPAFSGRSTSVPSPRWLTARAN